MQSTRNIETGATPRTMAGPATSGREGRPPFERRQVRGMFHASRSPTASRVARDWITAEMTVAEPAFTPERIAEAALVVDELVNNVVDHTDSASSIRYGEDGESVVIEVYDRDPGHPRLLPPDPARDWGYGLRVVDALADRWGCTRLRDGRKFVWLEMRGRRRS